MSDTFNISITIAEMHVHVGGDTRTEEPHMFNPQLVQDLVAEVNKSKTVASGVIETLAGLVVMVETHKNDPEALQAALDTIKANNAALAAAVANVPANDLPPAVPATEPASTSADGASSSTTSSATPSDTSPASTPATTPAPEGSTPPTTSSETPPADSSTPAA